MALTPAKPRAQFTPTGVNEDVGFERVGVTTARRRMIVLVQGPPKTGKSHFALTAPGPLYYQSIDPGEEILEAPNKPWNNKEVYRARYDVQFPQSATEDVQAVVAEKHWNRFVANQTIALSKGRSLVLDTESDMWELFRLARTGRANPEKQSYMVISPEYRQALRSFYASNCNLVMLAKMKDEYKANKATGSKKRAGFSDADYLAQVVVQTFKADGAYGIRILDCRLNPAIEGMELENDFIALAQLVHEDSSEQEWK